MYPEYNIAFSQAIRYSSYLVIQDLVNYLKSPKISFCILSKNTEGRLEQSLTLACVLHLYYLYGLYILDQNLETLESRKLLGGGKMCCCKHWKRGTSFN